MKRLAFAICVLFLDLDSRAQTPTPATPSSVTVAANDLNTLSARVSKLEADLAKATPSPAPSSSTALTAIIAGSASLFAALVAGGLTLFGQHLTGIREERRAIRTAERELELARQQAVFENSGRILEFRVKQLEIFYAPMFALLEQSKALYIKMNAELAKAAPKKYRELAMPDEHGYRFKVTIEDGTEHGFRLLDRLPEVRAYPEAFALVERIIQIGEMMTKIVTEHAGLASHQVVVVINDKSEKSMLALLGEYCAHFAILSSVYARGEIEPYPPGWHQIGYYPRELNDAIKDGYGEIQRFVEKYTSESEQMLARIEPAPGQTQQQSIDE